jgi:hypothetical protein
MAVAEKVAEGSRRFMALKMSYRGEAMSQDEVLKHFRLILFK